MTPIQWGQLAIIITLVICAGMGCWKGRSGWGWFLFIAFIMLPSLK